MIYSTALFKLFFIAKLFFATQLFATVPSAKTKSTVQTSPILKGVNGHPLNQASYQKISIDMQFDILKQLSVKAYRFDAPSDNNGIIAGKEILSRMQVLAARNKVTLLPMLYMAGLSFNDTEAVSFQKGYNTAYSFAKQVGKNITYYELGNEQEIAMGIPGRSGSATEDYDMTKVKIAAAFWKGMIAGVKAVNPAAKTIINCGGWFHFVFFGILDKEGVKYDIIGYHWYSDMDDYSKKVKVNIFKSLSQYNKPIWFTEVNVHNGTYKNSETYQSSWIGSFSKACKAYPLVKAIFVYELLDQPLLKEVTEGERNYGIVKWKTGKPGVSGWNFKSAGKLLLSL